MRTVVRCLFIAALVLSTCAMRAGSLRAQELTPEQEQLVLALINTPLGEGRVLVGRAPEP